MSNLTDLNKSQNENVIQTNNDLKPEGLGNTNKPAQKRYRAYCFTLNNPQSHSYHSHTDMIELLDSIGQLKSYIFQLEIGEEDETEHYQGFVTFKNQIQFKEILKLDKNIHWEPTRSCKASIEYCQKIKGRISGPWAKDIKINNVIDPMPDPYGWQLEIVNMINTKADRRTIIWGYDKEGHKGKSDFTTWLCDNKHAMAISGKSSDVYHALANCDVFPNIIIYDIPRSFDHDYLNYTTIEQIKTGRIFSPKYESKCLRFNSPHIIIFSNSLPQVDKVTHDRWKIFKIQSEKLIPMSIKEVKQESKSNKSSDNWDF
jgi:hypothetical protein